MKLTPFKKNKQCLQETLFRKHESEPIIGLEVMME
jgi:hypothetical protein